eukprot:TRINITY_DN5465_c0_g1_i1.p1 TRINITY_DN5465_c0_g1~~TRINITY_DN5465_c0_g1_i1.p1  ORF type:complete len:221 (+),score=16.76 TRINITY_DN5465_c0_g1_i1:55-663(+)
MAASLGAMGVGLLQTVLLMSLVCHSFAVVTKIKWWTGVKAAQTTFQINVGDSVQWNWFGTQTHALTALNAPGFTMWDPLPSGKGTMYSLVTAPFKYTYTFKKAGKFKFQCFNHPLMKGVITVGGASTSAGPPPEVFVPLTSPPPLAAPSHKTSSPPLKGSPSPKKTLSPSMKMTPPPAVMFSPPKPHASPPMKKHNSPPPKR